MEETFLQLAKPGSGDTDSIIDDDSIGIPLPNYDKNRIVITHLKNN